MDITEEKGCEEESAAALPVSVCQSTESFLFCPGTIRQEENNIVKTGIYKRLQLSSESLVLPVPEGGAPGIHILVQTWVSGLVSAHFITRSQNPVVEVVRLVSVDVMSRPADGLQRASRGGHLKKAKKQMTK